MSYMKRAAVLGAVTGLVLALSSCAGDLNTPSKFNNGDAWQEIDHTLVDGRSLHCLLYNPTSKTMAMSCDWASAK